MRNPTLGCLGLIALLTLCGCGGYQWTRVGSGAYGAGSIGFEAFENQTREPGLIAPLMVALRRTAVEDGTFDVVGAGEADIEVTGQLRNYQRRGLSFARESIEVVRDFRMTLVAEVTAVDKRRGVTLFENRRIEANAALKSAPDLAAAERVIATNLADELARKVVSAIADGDW